MRKITTIILFSLISVAVFAAGNQAESLLGKVKAAMAAKPSVDLAFTINGGSGPVQGSATMSADKYFMTTPALTVWYDGHTQWTFLKSSGEVSITEPSIDELMASNPFSILSSPAEYYTVKALSDSGGRKRVELTPKQNMSGVSKILLMINPATSLPTAISINFDDGRKAEVVIDNIVGGQARPLSLFRYDARRFPATEVIDLR